MKNANLTQANRWRWAVSFGTTTGLAALLLVALWWGIRGAATEAVVHAASLANPDPASANDVVTYTIRARAKGCSTEAGRITNLEEAARRLNAQLEAEGADYRVELQGELTNESWWDYTQRFVDDFDAGQAPDIVLHGHEMVGPWGAAGYVISLTDYISLEWTSTYSDFYPALWDAVTWSGERWAVPQDTEARPVYFRKDALRTLGWSDMQISQMVTDTLNGDFTLDDMGALAREAVQAGVVEWGLWHRPKAGPDFYILPVDYGGMLYNPATDHLVLSECPTYRSLTFFYNLANVWHVTPPTMTTEIDWGAFHQTIVDGDVLFWFGGTWQWYEWRDWLGGDEQYLWDNFGFMLYPPARRGDDPVTLSHPVVYMISSQSEHPTVTFQILTLASAPDLVAQHAVTSAHLAVRRAATQEPAYQADAFLQAVSYMPDYTTYIPNHEQEGEYGTAFFKAIQYVETGNMTPSEALNWLEADLQTTLGSELEIDTAPCVVTVEKSVTPTGQVEYGDALTYTLVIPSAPGAQVALYDPLEGTTFVRFVERPPGVTHASGVITGTLAVTPTEPVTVSFVVEVGIPGTAGWTVTVTNRACVYPAGGTIEDDCAWSDTVTNPAFRPYGIYLPLVLRNFGL